MRPPKPERLPATGTGLEPTGLEPTGLKPSCGPPPGLAGAAGLLENCTGTADHEPPLVGGQRRGRLVGPVAAGVARPVHGRNARE